MILDDFARVTRGCPCPVCGKTSWCLIAKDGSGRAVCKRVESDKPRADAGWLHVGGTLAVDPKRIASAVRSRRLSAGEIEAMCGRFVAGMDGSRLVRIAAGLCVSRDSLARLSIGFDGEAYTFPMLNADGEIVGFRRRFNDGRKLSVAGGNEGLFIPSGLTFTRATHLCEGPTSCAALLSMGFEAVGRPSCNSGNRIACDFIRRSCVRSVIVWGDRDKPKTLANGNTFRPGQDGAWTLAKLLAAFVPMVRVFIPTVAKDAREWLRAGATTEDVIHAIRTEATPLSNHQLPRQAGSVHGEARGLRVTQAPRPVGRGTGVHRQVDRSAKPLASIGGVRGAVANQAQAERVA